MAGLVTYCHHAIADDLPPPALMCADMLHIRCTHTHGARHLVLTASLSTRGCNPTHKRLQRVRSACPTTTVRRARCVLRACSVHRAITTRRCVMALVTAATWPVRAATGKNALTKKKKK